MRDNPAMSRHSLARAIERRSFVRIHRSDVVDFTIDGYVLAATDELVLLQPVRDRLDLDGYDVIRVADITKVARVAAAKAALYVDALALKGQAPRVPAEISIESMSALLRTASSAYPLIVTHREKAGSGCEIGRNVQITDGRYALDEISVSGSFDRESRSFDIADITLVQFDGGYENTLATVAARRRELGAVRPHSTEN